MLSSPPRMAAYPPQRRCVLRPWTCVSCSVTVGTLSQRQWNSSERPITRRLWAQPSSTCASTPPSRPSEDIRWLWQKSRRPAQRRPRLWRRPGRTTSSYLPSCSSRAMHYRTTTTCALWLWRPTSLARRLTTPRHCGGSRRPAPCRCSTPSHGPSTRQNTPRTVAAWSRCWVAAPCSARARTWGNTRRCGCWPSGWWEARRWWRRWGRHGSTSRTLLTTPRTRWTGD
mmetsp:Transcript_1493/g.4505  ORF Transcript_1493/g.4505 Transcript_1493/m.4505 type:complete len:227 (+) Transcript_1493:621-1301(+)